MEIVDLPKPVSFQWDQGNEKKSWLKHKVSNQECEEAFQMEDAFIQPDDLHSGREERYILISHTRAGRPLLVIFTVRSNQVRVVSARSMHRKEIGFYEEKARIAKIQE